MGPAISQCDGATVQLVELTALDYLSDECILESLSIIRLLRTFTFELQAIVLLVDGHLVLEDSDFLLLLGNLGILD